MPVKKRQLLTSLAALSAILLWGWVFLDGRREGTEVHRAWWCLRHGTTFRLLPKDVNSFSPSDFVGSASYLQYPSHLNYPEERRSALSAYVGVACPTLSTSELDELTSVIKTQLTSEGLFAPTEIQMGSAPTSTLSPSHTDPHVQLRSKMVSGALLMTSCTVVGLWLARKPRASRPMPLASLVPSA